MFAECDVLDMDAFGQIREKNKAISHRLITNKRQSLCVGLRDGHWEAFHWCSCRRPQGAFPSTSRGGVRHRQDVSLWSFPKVPLNHGLAAEKSTSSASDFLLVCHVSSCGRALLIAFSESGMLSLLGRHFLKACMCSNCFAITGLWLNSTLSLDLQNILWAEHDSSSTIWLQSSAHRSPNTFEHGHPHHAHVIVKLSTGTNTLSRVRAKRICLVLLADCEFRRAECGARLLLWCGGRLFVWERSLAD